MKEIKSVGIVLAGGIGNRFGGDKPKQYYLLDGKEIIWYSINAFRQAKLVDEVIVVVGQNEYDEGRIATEYCVMTIVGGKTRNHSFKNALDYIKNNYPHCIKIIENNAACPLIRFEQIDEYIELLDKYDFVQTTYKITDALGSYKERHVDREDYFLIQAPDAYRFDLLYNCFDANNVNGHPAVQLPKTSQGYNYFVNGQPFKVTYPEDIEIAEIYLKRIKK